MVHAIFYLHQSSGVCAGACACNCTHQMEKTGVALDAVILPNEILFKL